MSFVNRTEKFNGIYGGDLMMDFCNRYLNEQFATSMKVSSGRGRRELASFDEFQA